MRVLFVAMSESVHTARWIAQLQGQGWDLHVFPSKDAARCHPMLRDVTVHHSIYPLGERRADLRLEGLAVPTRVLSMIGRRALARLTPDYRVRALAAVIARLRPDVLHALEFQAAGYLTLAARELAPDFPPWIMTNWGSDLYHFGRSPGHAERLRAVLAACDAYSCETTRDVGLAHEFGFSGTVLPVIPNAGGLDLAELAALRAPGPTSARRKIMVKGYQGWAGRGLVALAAVERCRDLLQGYEVLVYSADPPVEAEARRLAAAGLPVTLVPSPRTGLWRSVPGASHRDILALHGQARVAVGLSLTDGLSTSFVEAFAMGAFPVQSDTSGAGDLIVDRETGWLVPPEDVEAVAIALRRALTDDALVDAAAARNLTVARERLDAERVAAIARGFYPTARGLS